MRHRIKRRGIAAFLVLCTAGLLLTGCGREEKAKTVKIVTEDVSDKYDLALVDIRDVKLMENITCTYSQLNEQKLSFTINGRRVAYVYVDEGSEVKAGDIVAELDVEDLEDEVFDLRSQIQVNELKLTQTQELIDFYDSRINSSKYSLAAKEDYILLKEECEENIIDYNSSIDYANERIEKDQEIIEASKLYAGMDGTVSSIKEDLDEWSSVAGTVVLTIIDTSVCAFKGVSANAGNLLKVGDKAEVATNSGNNLDVTVTDIDDSGNVVFELDEPDYSLAIGARGTVSVLLEEKEQVPSLPRATVYNTDEYYYVFQLNDEGVRELKKVEVGLIGNDYVEIVDGIELNSSVILRQARSEEPLFK